jgi:predicted nucleic-acid-binding protein
MIGLDTNILVRLLVGDDQGQTAQAEKFVNDHCSPASPGFVNCVVLTELVWVLANPLQYSRAQIARVLENLLAGTDRVIDCHNEVHNALADYKAGKLDFVDALILHINRARGCEATATFDRKAARVAGFMQVR